VAVNTAGGTPRIALNSGGTALYTGGTGTTILTFTYTVAAGQNAADLDYTSTSALTLNGGAITEVSTGQNATLTLPAPGAAGSLGFNKNITIDTQAPVVTAVSSTVNNGTYGAGASIPITVTFSEPVTVNIAGGTPRIALNSGGTALYTGGTATTTLTFTYTVGATDSTGDLDYTAAGINLSGGTITEASTGQNATLTLPAPGTAGSLGANKDIVIDTTRAGVVNVTSTKPDGSYAFGAVIDITVQFDQVVNVTGSPQLALNTGATATYLSGTGTTTLTFRYTVGSGQNTPDLDYASTTALTGGTIQDTNGQGATLTLPAPGAAGSLGANKNIAIDSIGPTVLEFRVLFGSKSYDLMGSTRFDLPWLVTGVRVVFSEPVYFGNVRSLTGLTATRLTGLRTRTLTWNFSGIAKGSLNTVLASTGLNALKDAAGNPIAAFSKAFKVLYGDFNDDGAVTAADEAGVRGAMAAPYQLLNPVGYNIFADLSGDGIVNLVDVGITRTRRGTSLP
ncbi:MAG TPA: hypothetical protein VKD90_22600, partial [Gemmataceae bacterium]|nr:hypothetical protein [Gemmataceae bacterium]